MFSKLASGVPLRARSLSFTVAALVAGGALSPAVQAADDATLAQLRQQIDELRQQYEGRLKALEARVQAAEAQARSAPAPTAGAAAAAQPAAQAVAARARDNRFNPAVALVLSGTYAHLSKDPDTWGMAGFVTGDDEIGPGDKGLSLGESELTLSANIDPWWFGQLTFALTPDNEAEVEEAFVQTTALSNGLTVKAGRFLSGVGYQNSQHAHTWDFVDAPLAYQAFLGGQLKHDGVQATWVLPTDTFVQLGAEVARGAASHNGAGASAVFAQVGGDVGASHSWRLGLSHLWARPVDREWEVTDLSDNEVLNSFSGKSRTLVLDGVWKWAPEGNAQSTNFKLQGEYFRRTDRGDVTYDVGGEGELADAYKATQSGWYLQGVYQFMPAWRVGLRHDQLDSGSVDYGLNNASLDRADTRPQRTSLMVDWAPSEFSRWRLQFSRDRARADETDNQVYLQYQMNLGAHGAHSF